MASSETGQLIQAVNRLTQTVQDKIADIDRKVDSVANDIRANTGLTQKQVFYVDAEAGDDLATGSDQRPFKTVNKALRSAHSGAVCTIRLQRNQRHVVTGDTSVFANHIYIVPWTKNQDTRHEYHYDTSTPVLDMQGKAVLYGSITIGSYQESIIVEASGTSKNDSARFTFYAGGGFTLARSRVILNFSADNTVFLGGPYSYISPNKVALRQADIQINKGYLSNPCHLTASESTGFEYVEDLILKANKDNTLSDARFKS
ncbi:hypothetical protein GCM10007938_00660 [Vibrio zhanjiangensis]|uniref:Uncharacterized protein n=1 Tax=Vibrio zhanjiangensis TaxID=1046128 RepID=A0ABQ6EUL3_9VIBR|nr:hypothetical protein [Vibrio zhanjiangensis]GLT16290.1 hypothetical protein GCM10007938_00660 [Vibrio zhanjiangensis]